MGFFPRPSLAAQLTFLPDTPIARREVGGAGMHQGEHVAVAQPDPIVLHPLGVAMLMGRAIGQAVYGGDGPLGPKPIEGQKQLRGER